MENTKGNFSSLNPKARIFNELINKTPSWWSLFINDKDLYIDIRKDNYINVYYYGSSIAKINFKNDFIAKIHKNYHNDYSNKTSKNNYCTLNLEKLDKNQLFNIKEKIKNYCCKPKNEEHPSEKQLQGNLRIKYLKYIDSEFQFNLGEKNLRIDLVELSNGILTFVELKRITDTRLRNYDKPAEIVSQMKKYQDFIENNEAKIKDYYIKLIQIKNKLGLSEITAKDLKVNKKPKLLIIDTYQKMTDGRRERILCIKKLSRNKNIDFELIKYLS